MKAKQLVVFDVGKTLVRCTHKEIAAFLYRNNRLSLLTLWRIVVLFFFHRLGWVRDRNVGEISRRVFKHILKGWSVDEANTVFKECFEQVIQPRLLRRSCQLLRRHVAAGHAVVLISAFPGGVIERLREYVGADFAIYPDLETRDGKFTGNVLGPFPYGDGKCELVRDLANRESLSLRESHAYADRVSDADLLGMVTNPCAVNPDPALRRHATAHGWPVCECA